MDDALDLYETNTKFRSWLWPKFVYTYLGSVGNEWLCAAKCALRYTNCHFYWHSGSYCYIGDFTRHAYTYLGDTNAPIKVLKGRYGMFVSVCILTTTTFELLQTSKPLEVNLLEVMVPVAIGGTEKSLI